MYCRGCDEQYIGETNNLRNRTTIHNQHIRHEALRKIPLSGHIAYCSDKEQKYFMFPFFQMKSKSIIERKKKKKSSLSERFYQSLMLCNICVSIMQLFET